MRAWRYLLLFLAMAALHQDFWLWRDGSAILGIVPVGLAYHVGYTVLSAVVLGLLVRNDWPSDIDRVETERVSDP